MSNIKEAIKHILVDTSVVVGGFSFAEAGLMFTSPEFNYFVVHNPGMIVAAVSGALAMGVGADIMGKKYDAEHPAEPPFHDLQGIG